MPPRTCRDSSNPQEQLISATPDRLPMAWFPKRRPREIDVAEGSIDPPRLGRGGR
jgi:hypothetical protein